MPPLKSLRGVTGYCAWSILLHERTQSVHLSVNFLLGLHNKFEGFGSAFWLQEPVEVIWGTGNMSSALWHTRRYTCRLLAEVHTSFEV